MASTSTKVGHGLAKALGIKLHYRDETESAKLTRGESVFSVESADDYVEYEPTAGEWLRSVTPSGRDVGTYLHNLFPFTKWITHYNTQWLIGDLTAGTGFCPALCKLCRADQIPRHYHRRRRRSSGYGLRQTG